MSIPSNDFVGENDATDGSDADPDAAGDDDGYYRPISSSDDSDSDDPEESGYISTVQSNGGDPIHLRNPNPNFLHLHAENGISTLDLNNDGGEGVLEVEEEVTEREASISRAFREDENRRAAPLTPENAARVMDAMRGVAFRGFAPDWADQVPEGRWVDQLRRLRGEPTSQS